MGRYLLYLSYIGRGFSGLQKQQNDEVRTICGLLEKALLRLGPSNDVTVVTSSRTDKGVNALCNTVHVDLQHSEPDKEFDPDRITIALNQIMLDFKADIRILKTRLVKDEFHCRFCAVQRHYIYRLCRVTNAASLNAHLINPATSWKLPISPLEFLHSFTVITPLDIDKVREATEQLSGTHDFTSFCVPTSVGKHKPMVNPVKTLHIDVVPGEAFLEKYQAFYSENFEHFEFHFKSKSFLHKQIRKMMAVILAVGKGQIDLETLKRMRDEPGNGNIIKNTSIYYIPSYALYLKNVQYNAEDLAVPDIDSSQLCGPNISGYLKKK